MKYHIRILAGRLDRSAGSHVYHQQLAQRLAARGHRVSLVCFEAVPGAGDYADIVEIPPASWDKVPFFWRFASFLQHRHCTRQLLRRTLPCPDIVIGGEHLFLQGHHRLFPGTPWLYLPHSLLVDQEIKSYQYSQWMEAVSMGVYVSLQRWALNHATRTVRFTTQACEALRTRYGRAVQPRFFVNPMGIEVPPPCEHGQTNGAVRLLAVGQLIPRKRIEVALTALANLRQYSWRLDLVGAGVAREGLESQACRLGLADRIHFQGFQADPGPWYRQADLLLFPSWLENFPVAMLEAMSQGVPCLAMCGDGVRYHTANAEIIRDGVDGFLAASDDDFRLQLEKLLQVPQHLRSAGKAARARVEEHYTWSQHLDRYESLFEHLMTGDMKDGGRTRIQRHRVRR